MLRCSLVTLDVGGGSVACLQIRKQLKISWLSPISMFQRLLGLDRAYGHQAVQASVV